MLGGTQKGWILLYFVPFFVQTVLTFSVFCGLIGIVHSDDPFGILCVLLNSTTESLLWTFLFSCYRLR